MNLKPGDIVKLPETLGHNWKENQGQVVFVNPPFCRVLVYYNGHPYRIVYKIKDVEKI